MNIKYIKIKYKYKKHVTNSAMIMTLFPFGKVIEKGDKIIYSYYPNFNMEFTKEWWNEIFI